MKTTIVALALLSLITLTIAQPVDTTFGQIEVKETEDGIGVSFSNAMGIAYQWSQGIWNFVTGKVERAVIIQRVNIDQDHLIFSNGSKKDSPIAFRPVETNKATHFEDDSKRNLYDEWIMISMPVFIVILVVTAVCSSIMVLLRCSCCC